MPSNKNQSLSDLQLFFIALLPSVEAQEYANQIKHHFADVYASKGALKSPPHVTLQPPFKWDINYVNDLENVLADFVLQCSAIPLVLENFAAFKPRVIYIDVHKTPELLAIQKDLNAHLESTLNIVDKMSKRRAFTPHLTVGFRDLSKANFYRAWDEFKEKKVYFQCDVSQLTLLKHNGKKWDIYQEFNLPNKSL